MFGASDFGLERLSERRCVLEVDLQHMSPDDIPKNRTYRILVALIVFHWPKSITEDYHGLTLTIEDPSAEIWSYPCSC